MPTGYCCRRVLCHLLWSQVSLLRICVSLDLPFPLAGPFYRYRTYHDWLYQGAAAAAVPSLEPLLLRARLAPIFGLLFLLSSWFFPLEAVREDAFYGRSLAFRLFYMVPIFFAFRMRFYVAWIAAECDCIAAGFGAYPVGAKSRAGGGPTQPYPAPDRSAFHKGSLGQRDDQVACMASVSETSLFLLTMAPWRTWLRLAPPSLLEGCPHNGYGQ